MRLIFLCILALVAFAANSVLNRSALALGEIGPAAFLSIRLISGALVLAVLVAARDLGALMQKPDWRGAASLLLYMVGFSYAYVSLQTGTGALILFGGVQITMFSGAYLAGERLGLHRWIGSVLGLSGLAVLFFPGATAPSLTGAVLMIAAALGWGVYSILGKGAIDPSATTARNFIAATPIAVLLWLVAPLETSASTTGILLAVASGALASGLGYAIWYSVLPHMDASLAAIAQLAVPIIALLGGVIFLNEPLTLRFLIAATLVICGVLAALYRPKKETAQP